MHNASKKPVISGNVMNLNGHAHMVMGLKSLFCADAHDETRVANGFVEV